jgi:hypothetical protein
MEARCVLCEVQAKIAVSGEGLKATRMSKETSSSPLNPEEHERNQIKQNMISILVGDLRPDGDVLRAFSDIFQVATLKYSPDASFYIHITDKHICKCTDAYRRRSSVTVEQFE